MERQLLREARLLSPPPTVQHTVPQLRQVVQLLLLCTSTAERQLVGWYGFHKLPHRQAAAEAGLTEQKARETLDSLRLRAARAEARQQSERRLARWDRVHSGTPKKAPPVTSEGPTAPETPLSPPPAQPDDEMQEQRS
ncbi:MAG: hypothetical protein ACM359_00380 [Bacillota bacterium]